LGAIAWRFRAPAINRHSLVLVWECAIVSSLILLYSPLTWGQHCVGALPLLYLLVRWSASHGRTPRATRVALALFVAGTLVLNRGVLGKDLTWILESYRVQTWCLVGLVIAGLAAHREVLRWELHLTAFEFDPESVEPVPASTERYENSANVPGATGSLNEPAQAPAR
jgi:hypothetical protein